MTAFSEHLAAFLSLLQFEFSDWAALETDLRNPGEAPRRIWRGSEKGARLWSSDDSRHLLDVISNDSAVREAFGSTDPRGEAMQTLAGLARQWFTTGEPPMAFAQRVETTLWQSLRRTVIYSIAVAVVPKLQPHGRN